MKRPALSALREQVRLGRVRKLYVFRLDRLSRAGIRETLGLLEQLRQDGCSVVSISDGFDLEGPGAEIVAAVMAWAAQFERMVLADRIRVAQERIRANGGAWGRPRLLSKGQVRTIQKLRREGRSIRAIAIAVKVKHSTVANVLSKKGAYAQVERPREKRAGPPSSK